MSWTVHLVLCILLFAKGVWCLRMIEMQVPDRVYEGDTIRLICLFDLGDETLYSVKWYRDGSEFFRYLPRDKPPEQYFNMEGVRVEVKDSGYNFVTLKDVDSTTSGGYTCEVSGEAPSFMVVMAEDDLTVKEKGIYPITEETYPIAAASSSNRITYGLLFLTITVENV